MRLGIVGFVVLVACTTDGPPERPLVPIPPSAVGPQLTPAPEGPPPVPPPAPAEVVRREDIQGIGIAFHADGRISVTGQNRWGRPLDATYASEDYFRAAVPLMVRTTTPEQGAALEAFVEGLHR
jgi:hypothetical protein